MFTLIPLILNIWNTGIEILNERFNDPAPGFYDDMILFGYDDLNEKGYVQV